MNEEAPNFQFADFFLSLLSVFPSLYFTTAIVKITDDRSVSFQRDRDISRELTHNAAECHTNYGIIRIRVRRVEQGRGSRESHVRTSSIGSSPAASGGDHRWGRVWGGKRWGKKNQGREDEDERQRERERERERENRSGISLLSFADMLGLPLVVCSFVSRRSVK